MTGALAAASEGTPANKAATMYGVPKSTLKDQISGRVVHGRNPGPCPYLDPDEEKEVADFLVSSTECGYGKTRREVAKTSPLSNYLSPMTPTAPRIKTGKARVLTSSECLAFLEEKERKKKDEVEEKERRKQDREAKRKQKEEEKRQKPQEKAKKAEERVKKAEEKARMATARATSKKAATTKVATTRATKRKTETSAPSAKRAKSADEQIDTNRCAICFGTYEDDIIVGSGEDWLQCTCGKWVHEMCVEDCAADSNGNPRFCPSCVEQYM